MSVHLNDISRVYLQQVAEKKESKKPNDGNLANNYPPYDEITRGDVVAGRLGKDEMGGKNKNKNKNPKESFSNWREDLKEIVEVNSEKRSKNGQIKEKEVNNYSGEGKCVVLNPEIKEGVQIIESVELSEEYVDQIIEYASQYFCEQGYNSKDIKLISEGMGHDQFVDFVFDIGNTFFLDEAAYQGELLTSKGQARKNPKVSAAKGASTPVSHTPSSQEKKKPEEKKSSPGQLSINYNQKPTSAGQERIKQAVGNVVKGATSPQTKKAVGGAVKGAANTAARAALSAWKGHQAAMKRKKEGASVAQQVGAGLGAAAGAFFKKGKEHLKNSYEFSDWLNYIISEGCDISEWTINDLYKHYKLNEAVYGGAKPEPKDTRYTVTAADKKANTPAYQKLMKGDPKYKAASHLNAGYELQGSVLDEKATSEQQQKLFGLALSVKRGQTSRSEVSQAVLDIVDKMSEKEIRKYAKTKHEGIPKKKVEEQLEPTTPEQITAQKKVALAQDLLNKANKKSLNKKVQNSAPSQSSAVEEGKIPVTRQAGDFKYPRKTGEEKAEARANVLSKSSDPARRRQANTIRKTIKTVADRDTAQASSAARQKLYRGQQLRANDLANQLIKAKSNVNSGYELEGNLVNETTPLFYKLQKAGKGGSSTARAQQTIGSDLQRQKDEKMNRQKAKQRQERETDNDHPSLSARERNPNLR